MIRVPLLLVIRDISRAGPKTNSLQTWQMSWLKRGADYIYDKEFAVMFQHFATFRVTFSLLTFSDTDCIYHHLNLTYDRL